MADEPGSHGLLSVQLPSESQVFSAFALSARMAGKDSIRTVGQQLQNFCNSSAISEGTVYEQRSGVAAGARMCGFANDAG